MKNIKTFSEFDGNPILESKTIPVLKPSGNIKKPDLKKKISLDKLKGLFKNSGVKNLFTAKRKKKDKK